VGFRAVSERRTGGDPVGAPEGAEVRRRLPMRTGACCPSRGAGVLFDVSYAGGGLRVGAEGQSRGAPPGLNLHHPEISAAELSNRLAGVLGAQSRWRGENT